MPKMQITLELKAFDHSQIDTLNKKIVMRNGRVVTRFEKTLIEKGLQMSGSPYWINTPEGVSIDVEFTNYKFFDVIKELRRSEALFRNARIHKVLYDSYYTCGLDYISDNSAFKLVYERSRYDLFAKAISDVGDFVPGSIVTSRYREPSKSNSKECSRTNLIYWLEMSGDLRPEIADKLLFELDQYSAATEVWRKAS